MQTTNRFPGQYNLIKLNLINYKGYAIDIRQAFIDLDIQYEGLTRNQARAIERYYIENGPNALNKINSISPNNKYYQDAMNWAKQYLGVE